ncbi:hypothetical protein CY34DRAFT_19521 [Suillus luteus UH-Slu-Lm8-n1]|uniref:Uncharacterized protein n=1 Tax=Suillus luteus UH-Slu-Lm8-n1 TaxID=930992 RepID=A0A0D0A0X7_9AGAM|nr:hypothetical protein CY34DRAFT_19521 [Suillus luteus UH-Slu-Lm8-n1]
MSPESDWDSSSMDSRPSGFNDGAEAILMNANFEIDAPGGGEEDNQSGSSPESHKGCQRHDGHGQGAPALEPLNGNLGNIDESSLKRKMRDENETLHIRDITNAWEASVPAIELPPSKRMKLDKPSESFEERLARSRVKIVQEVFLVLKALDRIKELLDEQTCDL